MVVTTEDATSFDSLRHHDGSILLILGLAVTLGMLVICMPPVWLALDDLAMAKRSFPLGSIFFHDLGVIYLLR